MENYAVKYTSQTFNALTSVSVQYMKCIHYPYSRKLVPYHDHSYSVDIHNVWYIWHSIACLHTIQTMEKEEEEEKEEKQVRVAGENPSENLICTAKCACPLLIVLVDLLRFVLVWCVKELSRKFHFNRVTFCQENGILLSI